MAPTESQVALPMAIALVDAKVLDLHFARGTIESV